MPYYNDPNLNVKLTQSNAILMHIARTNDLWPVNEETSLINADLLREEFNDLFRKCSALII